MVLPVTPLLRLDGTAVTIYRLPFTVYEGEAQ